VRLAARVFAAAAIAVFAFAAGYLAHRNEWIPFAWRDCIRGWLHGPSSGANVSGDWAPRVSEGTKHPELDAIGYLQAYEPAPAQSGVTLNRGETAQSGYNLYNSGHAPEACLMDMDGRVLHTWRRALRDVWPGYVPPSYLRHAATQYWRRVRLGEHGELFALFDGVGLVKLDKDSNVLWSHDGQCHHDLDIAKDGAIYVLTQKLERVACLNARKEVLHPTVTELAPDGQVRRVISLAACFAQSPYAALLDLCPDTMDVFHANTVKILDGRHASRSDLFREGNLLISIRSINTVAIVDPDRETVAWALTGLWRQQHEPILCDNGNLLVFDNQGDRGKSQIIEVDPFTQRIAWRHGGFDSAFCGSVRRLPNGNTLITETNGGRAFEVTPDHAVVWEFVNPHQRVENGVPMIAALLEVERLPISDDFGWLSR